jgi:hypothetical protein
LEFISPTRFLLVRHVTTGDYNTDLESTVKEFDIFGKELGTFATLFDCSHIAYLPVAGMVAAVGHGEVGAYGESVSITDDEIHFFNLADGVNDGQLTKDDEVHAVHAMDNTNGDNEDAYVECLEPSPRADQVWVCVRMASGSVDEERVKSRIRRMCVPNSDCSEDDFPDLLVAASNQEHFYDAQYLDDQHFVVRASTNAEYDSTLYKCPISDDAPVELSDCTNISDFAGEYQEDDKVYTTEVAMKVNTATKTIYYTMVDTEATGESKLTTGWVGIMVGLRPLWFPTFVVP